MPTQIRNSDLSNLVQTDGYRFGLWTEVVAGFQALPGLVGFWPMSSVQRSTGNVYDLSGQNRTLTYNGNPTFSYTGLVPYITFDGTGDYLSRADETDLDIVGSEAIFNSATRGLTLGGWFYTTDVGAGLFGLMSKYASSQISFLLYRSADTLSFTISNTGTALVGTVSSSTALVANNWNFIVGRFTPSTETALFNNDTKNTNTTSIPATIFNSTTALEIGRYNSSNTTCYAGRTSLCFLSANAISDSIINGVYQRSRNLFGV